MVGHLQARSVQGGPSDRFLWCWLFPSATYEILERVVQG